MEKYIPQSTGAIRKMKSVGVQTDDTPAVVDQPTEVIEIIEDIELSDNEHCLKLSNGMDLNIKVQEEEDEGLNDTNRFFTFYAECPICLLPIGNQPICSTNCGHVFCTECIEKSLKTSFKCPICKNYLDVVHSIFLPVKNAALKK